MNPVDKIAYEYAEEHGVVGLDYEQIYDAVKYGYNRAIEDAWKPSEEQMEALAWYSGDRGAQPTGDEAIKSLYNDLKKL